MEQERLVILHATDVHMAFEKVHQLQDWIRKRGERIDIVLVSGDIANMPMDVDNTATAEEVAKHHSHLEQVVKEFTTISTKVYYVPGNHDAISTFKTSGFPTTNFPCNMHMRMVSIAPYLCLMGQGGSVPGFRNGKQVHLWNGFPYRTDEDMGKDLRALLDPAFLLEPSSVGKEDTVILMTHNGPSDSCTTLARKDPLNPIQSGCSVLHEYLCKEELQRHVIMNIHGHTHDASGRVRIGNITVLNPGALIEGNFAIYTLEFSGKGTQKWELSSTCFYKLP